FLAIPFAFLVTRKSTRKVEWKRGIKYGFASCLAGALLILPWVAYNFTRFDHPVYLSNGVGSVLMTANCDSRVPSNAPLDAGKYDFFRPNQNIFLNGVLEGRGRWQSRLATYEYFPLLGFSIVGLVLLRRRRVPILPFLAIALTISVTAATSFGITRYRAPF